MIIGIGIDICDIKRIDKTLLNYGGRFKQRCFTKEERNKCDRLKNSSACYAKRFSAKESVSKALGTGMRKGVSWKNIEIINLKSGDEETEKACRKLYRELVYSGFDILYDDRDDRAGVKFATMDLIGIPWQIILGPRSLAEGYLELKFRKDGVTTKILLAEGANQVANKLRS